MDKDIQELFSQVLANQVVIFKRLDQIEKAVRGSSRLAPIGTYIDELKSKADEVRDFIRKSG